MAANPPPTAFLQSPWFPIIFAFYIRIVEVFRQVGGLTATSWFRTPSENDAVNGSPESQHLLGLAMDVASSREGMRATIDAARRVGLVPADEGNHVHLQLFPGGALARVGVRFPS